MVKRPRGLKQLNVEVVGESLLAVQSTICKIEHEETSLWLHVFTGSIFQDV